MKKWQISGFIFTAILGTFLHFLFDLTDRSSAAALFSAVNESIWEHMKLLYYPMLIFAVVESRYVKATNFWCVKLIGTLIGLVLIPVLYYTYTGVFGINADWFNIAIFFIVAAIVFYLEAKLLGRFRGCRKTAAISLFLLIAAVFTIFTFMPPKIPLLQDPVTGTYGFYNFMP